MNFSNISILKKIGLFAVFMVCLTSLKATHIVGGSMTYTCLGNNNYEVQLRIYRDCFYADPRAFFDDPAYIGVFDQNNKLIGNLQLPLLNNDTIPPVLNDPCLFVPADVCVHTTTYRGTINLPYRVGGYQLAYERCCRNETILNIVDPLNAGAVYSTFLSETALLECNNSAKFVEWPPLFVCVNEPIDWDHSALDVDGDSLVYSLCTPLSGGSQARPKPVPTNNPPYDNVIWNDPAYNLDNLLGGVPLTIDSETGRLTAIPGVMGQFVVGICVSEYRNGEKISETRRDFQYNVGECGMVESTIVAPAVQCENLSVTFTNESQNADGYRWNFNDPNNPGATSTLAEPTYAYSEPGTYTIELIASTREVCTDTSYHTIFLQRNSMIADFEVDVQDCVNSSSVIATDRSTDPISNPSQWSWTLSEGGVVTQSSNLQHPIFTVATPAAIELTLTTTSENGCVDDSTKNFQTQINDPGDQISSDIEVCIGTETEINPDSDPGYSYQWDPNPYFTDLTDRNPNVNLTEDAQLTVSITSEDESCAVTKTVNLTVRDIPAINEIADQLEVCLGSSVQLNLTEYANLDFTWTGTNLDNPNSDTPFASPTSDASYSVVITESSGQSCSVTKEINVVVNDNPDAALALVNDQTILCKGASASLNPNGDANFDYTWDGEGLNGVTTLNPTVGPTATANYDVTVTNRTSGCTSEKTIAVFVPADINLSTTGDRNICFDSETTLQALGTGDLTFEWMGADGSIMSSESILFFKQNESEDIQLTARNAEGCSETILVQVEVAERISALDDLPESVVVCENIPTPLSSNENNQLEYLWSPSTNLDDATSSIPVFTSDVSTTYTVEVTNPDTGCKLDKSMAVNVPASIDLNTTGDRNICFDSETTLQAVGTGDLTFEWMGADGSIMSSESMLFFKQNESEDIQLTARNAEGCSETILVQVEVAERISALDDLPESVVVCENIPTPLSSNENNQLEYLWSPSTNLDDASSSIPVFTSDVSTTYTVEVTNPDTGCKLDKSMAVNVPASIDLNTTGDRNICFDSETTLQAVGTGDLTFEWMSADGSIISSESTLFFKQNESEDIQLTARNAEGCSETILVQVEVAERISALDNLPESVVACENIPTPLHITENKKLEFLWSPSANIDDAFSSIPVFTSDASTTYTVEVTNPDTGCKIDKSLAVNVPASIDLNTTGDRNICFDSETTLQAIGTGDLTFEWMGADGSIMSSESMLFFKQNESEDIQLTARNAQGCFETILVQVEVAERISALDNLPESVVACENIPTPLSSNQNNQLDYLWSPSANLDDASSSIPVFTSDVSTTYTVEVTNPDTGCKLNKSMAVNVPASIDLNTTGDRNICFDSETTLQAVGTGDLTFEWMSADGSIISSESMLLFKQNESEDIQLTARNAEGCSETILVQVEVAERISALDNIPESVVACENIPTPLSSNQNNQLDYLWSPSANLDDASSSIPVFTSDVSTTYTVEVTNPDTGCKLDKSMAVNVPASIDLNTTGDRNICFDSETTLQAVGTGDLTFEWMSADGSIMSSESMLLFKQNESEDIQLTARNTEGCTETVLISVEVAERVTALDNQPDSVLVCENIPTSLSSIENNQFEFSWSPTANIDDATSSIPVFTSDQTTVYTVQATNPQSGCTIQKSVRAVVPAKIDLNVTDDITTCGDTEVLLTASSNIGESYTWIRTDGASIGSQATVSVDPRTSAKYLVEVVDEFGCMVVDSVRVNFVGITAHIAQDNLETCDDEVQLSLTDVNPTSDNVYTWGPSEAILSGESSPNPIVLNDSNEPITFTVTITNEGGCRAQDQVTVTNKFDLTSLDVGRNACVDIDLNLNPDFNDAYEYSWEPAHLLNDPTAANPSYSPTMDQLFTVTVTDNDGCTTIREVQVSTVDLNTMVDINLQADTILNGEQTQLEVTFDPDFSYLWIPPTSLSSNTISNPIATPTRTTNYSVMVTNSQGCVATKTITLNVLSSECNEPFVFFPNAFTPNGDGLNDVLRVRGNALSEVRFIIYDRWGERIFETNSVDGAWDGTYKGKQLPPDVYGYYLEAKCIFGGEYKKQGNVTLLD